MTKQNFGTNIWRGVKVWVSGLVGGILSIPVYLLSKWLIVQGHPIPALIIGIVGLGWWLLATGYTAWKLFGIK